MVIALHSGCFVVFAASAGLFFSCDYIWINVYVVMSQFECVSTKVACNFLYSGINSFTLVNHVSIVNPNPKYITYNYNKYIQ